MVPQIAQGAGARAEARRRRAETSVNHNVVPQFSAGAALSLARASSLLPTVYRRASDGIKEPSRPNR